MFAITENIREVGLPLYLIPARLEIAASGHGAKQLLSGRWMSTRNAGRSCSSGKVITTGGSSTPI
ncbi:MAG: hypothetical protein EOS79_31275 [Mesorhizobium sp.]|nr:MAG: hypothetical protein EOS79_31275 [Mesorhizobium sp.]